MAPLQPPGLLSAVPVVKPVEPGVNRFGVPLDKGPLQALAAWLASKPQIEEVRQTPVSTYVDSLSVLPFTKSISGDGGADAMPPFVYTSRRPWSALFMPSVMMIGGTPA